MKRYALLSVVAALVLGGCTSQIWIMGDKDRKLLMDARDMAQQAKDANAQAAADAKAAREAAEKALALAQQAGTDAQQASTKADRMFEAGHNK